MAERTGERQPLTAEQLKSLIGQVEDRMKIIEKDEIPPTHLEHVYILALEHFKLGLEVAAGIREPIICLNPGSFKRTYLDTTIILSTFTEEAPENNKGQERRYSFETGRSGGTGGGGEIDE